MKNCWPFIIGTFLFVGCAHYQPQPVSPEQTAAVLDSRRLDDPGLRAFLEQNLGRHVNKWPEENWDLNELTLAAFYFHPGLDVARAQWLVALAGVKTAGARPNPSVSLTPGYDNQIPGNYSPWLIPLSFDIPIEIAGKRGKRVAEAEKASESARWNFISAAWQIRREVRSSLLDLQVATQRATLLEQQFVAQEKIVSRLKQRVAFGEISRMELATEQIVLSKTRMDLGDAKSTKSAAHAQLAGTLGLSEAALSGNHFQFDFSTRNLDQLTSSAARAVALRSRADVLAALADYAGAENDLRLEVAKQYPDLHLGPGYAWNYGNAGDGQWLLGATLELPILDQNQGPIAEATARRKLAAAKFVELQSRVIGEIDCALAGLRAAREQMKSSNELLAAERQQEKFTQSEAAAGAVEQLDVLNAQLETNAALLTRLDSEAKLQSAIGLLEDALQQPNDSLATAIEKMTTEAAGGKSTENDHRP